MESAAQWQSNKEILGESKSFKQVGGEQHEHIHMVSAYQAFLLPLGLLHHKIKVIKHLQLSSHKSKHTEAYKGEANKKILFFMCKETNRLYQSMCRGSQTFCCRQTFLC